MLNAYVDFSLSACTKFLSNPLGTYVRGAYLLCMNHDRMYKLSSELEQLFRRYRHPDFLGFHAYRYKFFVDTSPRGRHCRYAAATLRLYVQDQEAKALQEFLQQLEPAPPNLQQLQELLHAD